MYSVTLNTFIKCGGVHIFHLINTPAATLPQTWMCAHTHMAHPSLASLQSFILDKIVT